MTRHTTGLDFELSSMIQLLQTRAVGQPEDRAFTFLRDGEVEERHVTFRDLDEMARVIGAWLQSIGAGGERVLLVYPPGLDFIAAFFGCLYAGAVAVPVYPPRRNRAMPQLRTILADANATVALTTSTLLSDIQGRWEAEPDLAAVRWQATDTIGLEWAADWYDPQVDRNSLAFLQYTSGSTGIPKGVMVSHGNLLQNEQMIGHAFQTCRRSVGVSWLPLYHDMGLIGLVLHPLYIGAHSILMSPVAFLQKPFRWLKAISDYRATISGGPNFAYEFCTNKITLEGRAELDLSCWEIAFTGAEPVRADALERFAAAFGPSGFQREAFYPCYGMAEATLIITGGRKESRPILRTVSNRALTQRRVAEGNGDPANRRTLVGCGKPRPGQRLVIVDPDKLTCCDENEVGEIWVSGPNVAQGYWNREEETERVFAARLPNNGDEAFLRTGDLGFVADGELYVTGRLKNLIIIRGRNYDPQDLESTVDQCHPALRTGCGAAFSVEADGEERLVIVQEVEREAIRDLNVDEVVGNIQAAVAQRHDLQLEAILLLKTTSIPKTSSGKIKHHACREGFLDGSLQVVGEWRRAGGNGAARRSSSNGRHKVRVKQKGREGSSNDESDATTTTLTAKAIERWLVAKLAERLGVAPKDIDVRQPFARYGLDSVAAVTLSNELEEKIKSPLPPTVAYDFPTVELLARHLAEDSDIVTESFATAESDSDPERGSEPIAVVGLGCRFPGAANPEAFWELMRDGREAISEVPADRWDADAYFDADPTTPQKMNTRWGGFLDQVDHFDPQFFGISPLEAESMDPQQRLLLEVSWEALEHAGVAADQLARGQTGVFIGISSGDYSKLQSTANAFSGTGNASSIAANRLSYVLDLRGPSWAVDTACSSSLVAVHQACQSLRHQECDVALAGGVNVILSPELTVAFSQAGLMASDGRCKAFDEAADGYVRGEGCGVIVLKRLADAIRDRDTIQAVIAGSAVNQDGRSNGLTAPNGPSQQAVVRGALEDAAVKPSQIDYIEAHGTGTALGDPIEVNSLKAVLTDGRSDAERCCIGSVKTNIGHLEAAAGIAGLIKIVLAVQRGEIPPHLNLKTLNPNILLDDTPLSIPTERCPWPNAKTRLAGVSSFGFGGTNAHVVVKQAPVEPERNHDESETGDQPRTRRLLMLSAKTDAARRDLADRYDAFLEKHADVDLDDLCYTANTGRSQFEYRLAVVSESPEQLRGQMASFAVGEETAGVVVGKTQNHLQPQIAMLFTGQGAQYHAMGRQLYETEPRFRETLERCHDLLRQHLDRPLLSLLYSRAGDRGLLDQTAYAQPALFSLEFALAQLWRSWGIQPAWVMGHSVGEYVAACVAGVFSLEDALAMIAERGARMQKLPGDGAMLAVMAEEARVVAALEPFAADVAMAAVNSPKQIVISGRLEAIDELEQQFESQGVRTRRLQVSHAFHSPLVDPMLDGFEAFCGKVTYSNPQIGLVSNVDGSLVCEEVTRPEYWRRHVRSPVRFADGIQTLRELGCDIFLEVGPKPTLLGQGIHCLPDGDDCLWIESLRPNRDDWDQLLTGLAKLYVHGVACDWHGFEGGRVRQKIGLPTYPFQRQRFWVDAPERATGAAFDATRSGHPLLGSLLRSAGKERVYENQLSAHVPDYLADHCLDRTPFLPVSAYLEMAIAAAADGPSSSSVLIERLSIDRAFELPAESGRTIQVVVTPKNAGQSGFEVSGLDGDERGKSTWTRHASAVIQHQSDASCPADINFDSLRKECDQEVSLEDLYQGLESCGVQYGPAFRTIQSLRRGAGQSLAGLRLPESLLAGSSAYHVHPVLLDSCVQVLGAALGELKTNVDTTWLPISIDRVQVFRRGGLGGWVHGRVLTVPDDRTSTLIADVDLYNADGEILCAIRGLRLERVHRSVLFSDRRSAADSIYQPRWQPQLRPGPQFLPEQVPDPLTVAQPLRAEARCLAEDVGLTGYEHAIRELETLSVDYIVRALQQLGWEFQVGEKFSTASLIQRLGVVQPHHRLAERLLEILAEEGFLRRVGDEWELERRPEFSEPKSRVERLIEQHPDAQSHVLLLDRCAIRLADVLRGNCDPLELLFPGGDTATLTALYQDSPGARVMNRLVQQAIAAATERLPDGRGVRILEIGAGTGGTTAHILPHLPADRSEYVFTDVSALFTSQAEEKFAKFPFLRTQILDIEKPPEKQGFSSHQFDIVVAANVIHATRDLRESLGHVRQLLAPGGILVLLEGTTPQRWLDLTFGMTDGWWRFSDETLRESYPLISSTDWSRLLTEFSFQQTAAISPDLERGEKSSRQTVIIAQTAAEPVAENSKLVGNDNPLGHWLIFADRQGTGDHIVSELERQGATCTRVVAGDVYEETSEGQVTIAPNRDEDYARLLSQIAANDNIDLRGIVHLWNLDAATADDLELEPLRASMKVGCGSVVHLVRELANARQGTAPKLWLVTQSAQPVADPGRVAGLAQAPLWGLGRTIALEHPELDCVRVDLDDSAPDQNAAILIDELRSTSDEDQIAFRGGVRYGARLGRAGEAIAERIADRETVRLSPEHSYLITGGWGGLGLVVAQWMVRCGARHLALIGRSEPTGTACETIREMQTAGASVELLRVNVADRGELDRVLTQWQKTSPPLAGVVHAAGVAKDGYLSRTAWDEIAATAESKIDGAWNLHRLTEELPLDFFVMFSSAAALLGSPGGGSYGAGNAFLDALAYRRRALGLPAASINWGPWTGIGMALDRKSQAGWKAHGMETIPVEQSLEVLNHVLAGDTVQVATLAVDWSKLLAKSTTPPYLSDFANAGEEVKDRSEFLQQLEQAAPGDRRSLLTAHLRSQVSKVRGASSSEPLDLDLGFFDLGMDSLTLVELRNRLQSSLSLSLPSTLAFDYPTLNALVDFLSHELPVMQAPKVSQEGKTDSEPSTACGADRETAEPIAVIGMSCRLPGGEDVESFWQMLRAGGDATDEVPGDRWDIDAFYDPDPRAPGKICCRRGAFLDQVDQFDADFFGIAPREAVSLDPQQRLLLETAWEALENAGVSNGHLAGSSTGVYVGIYGNDYARVMSSRDSSEIDAYLGSGNAHSVATGRLSYLLGLQGPSMAIDTACSSSLVATHLACQSLRNAECDLALAGGVSLMLAPERSINLSKSNMLAPDGRCKTFDASANGFVRGEGAGVVVLKRLSDARADGDRILAVIRGSAVNQDGASGGLTVPNGVSQQSVIRKALQQSGVKPSDVDYVEAHGTGTSLGDPIEVGALGAVFGDDRTSDRPLLIGSVKTNIGHLEAAAGVAGFVKVILALQHGEIPPHLHFDTPNPHIQWNGIPVKVTVDCTKWATSDRPRIAGISSFGFSGTNAHVIVEEAPAAERVPATDHLADSDRPARLLNLSAKTREGLNDLVSRYSQFLGAHNELDLQDICYTANIGRSHFSHRVAVIGDTKSQMIAKLAGASIDTQPAGIYRGKVPNGTQPKIAFLFTGQGSQYVGMGRGLYQTQTVFRDAIDTCAEILQTLLEHPLQSVLYPAEGQEIPLDNTGFAQPAIFALEYALAQLWKSWGIEPAVVLGHSVGEYVAACVAGVFGLEDGLKLIAHRARLMQSLPGGGRMVAVMTDEERVAEAVQPHADDVSIAAINGPRQVVVSGRHQAIEEMMARLEADGVRTKELVVSHAFHSPMMDPMLEEFRQLAEQVAFEQPQLNLISNTTGQVAGQDVASADYWVRHIRQPVRFARSIETAVSSNCDVFLELGAAPTLTTLARQCAPEYDATWLATLRPRRADWSQVLDCLGQLYALGAPIDWRGVHRDSEASKVTLPSYAFQRKRYWVGGPDRPGADIPNAATAKSMLSLQQGETEQLARQLADSGSLTDEEKKLLPKLLDLLAASQAEPEQTSVAKIGTDWLYEIQWQTQPRPEDGGRVDSEPGTWLVFSDHGAVGESLARLLEARGDRCFLVYQGSNGTVTSPQIRHIDAADAAAHESLIEDVLAEGGPPLSGIVHLWSLDLPNSDELDMQRLRRSQDHTCASILHLVKPLTKCNLRPNLWLATRGAVAAGGESEPLAVAQSPLWGFGKVLALEHPELWGGMIDLDATPSDTAAERLLSELTDPDDEDHIVWRGGERRVARLVRKEAERNQETPVRSDATYLITGGLGALGIQVARGLVERGARYLTLVGRGGAKSTEQKVAVEELQKMGANVLVLEADISAREDAERVIGTIKDTMPRLCGVIHAAGVLDDGVLLQQDRQRLDRVFAPKALGAWNLHTVTESMSLDFFICFSSVASLVGSPGQANYAAANAFLDGLAHYRRSQGLPSLTINWGPWRHAGMAAGLDRRNRVRWAAIGMETIEPEHGVEVLRDLWQQDGAQVGVFPIQWKNWGTGIARELPILRKLLDEVRGTEIGNLERSDLVERLKTAPEGQRTEMLMSAVCAEVAQVLGMEPNDLEETDRGFAELGFDSLMALELKERLQNALGCPLSSTLAFNYPSIEALVNYLSEEVLFAKPPTSSDCPSSDKKADAAATEIDDISQLGEDELISEIAERFQSHE